MKRGAKDKQRPFHQYLYYFNVITKFYTIPTNIMNSDSDEERTSRDQLMWGNDGGFRVRHRI